MSDVNIGEAWSGRGLLQDEPLIFETEGWAKTGVDFAAEAFGPDQDASDLAGLARDAAVALPGLSEPETVRHYVRLSQKNHAIDLALYPLGSCTMKHNPRLGTAARSAARERTRRTARVWAASQRANGSGSRAMRTASSSFARPASIDTGAENRRSSEGIGGGRHRRT